MKETHFKVGVDVFRDNVLGFGFVLTIDDVHVQFSLMAFEEWTQIAHVLTTFLNGLKEHTEICKAEVKLLLFYLPVYLLFKLNSLCQV